MEEQNNSLPAIYDDALIEAAQNAEKRIEAVKRIKTMSLRVTNPQDWTNQGGKPYPQVSGSEKIARLFGISWRIDQPIFQTFEDGHYSYEYKGYFSMGNHEIEAIGIRDSKDSFFWGGKDNRKPISEIDRGNVQKSAYTNCIGNGVTRLLGLRNLTWDDLKEAGVDISKIAKVEYGKPEMTEEAQSQRTQIDDMLKEMSGGDMTKYAEALKQITAFTGKDGKEVPGKAKLDDLSEKAIGVTLGKVQKIFDAWKAKNGQ